MGLTYDIFYHNATPTALAVFNGTTSSTKSTGGATLWYPVTSYQSLVPSHQASTSGATLW